MGNIKFVGGGRIVIGIYRPPRYYGRKKVNRCTSFLNRFSTANFLKTHRFTF